VIAALDWLWWTLPAYVVAAVVLVVAFVLYRRGRLS
jgi:hypothetical protein